MNIYTQTNHEHHQTKSIGISQNYSTTNEDAALLMASLQDGWLLLEAARYLAHGRNAEGLGYMLTLYHPQRRMVKEMNVLQSPALEAIFQFEGVPGN